MFLTQTGAAYDHCTGCEITNLFPDQNSDPRGPAPSRPSLCRTLFLRC